MIHPQNSEAEINSNLYILREMLKISIITATYNSGKTVGDTLKSVLAQTYHDYELLVVDVK